MVVTYGRRCPPGYLTAGSVDTEEEAQELIARCCDLVYITQQGVTGYVAPELEQNQTLKNLYAFGRRLEEEYRKMQTRPMEDQPMEAPPEALPLTLQGVTVYPNHSVAVSGYSLSTTPVEGKILRYLMERVGTVVSPQELASEAIHNPDVNINTVRRYIGNLRRCMNHLSHLIQTVPSKGYRFGP